jgi:hypothetical protein
MRRTLVVPSLLVAACASAPVPPPTPAPAAPPAPQKVTAAADLADHLGDSIETAVPVPKDAPNEGIDWMNNWTFDRFGRFRVQKRAIGHAGEGAAERRYRVTTIELPDGSIHTIYFDITENWNAWTPTSH